MDLSSNPAICEANASREDGDQGKPIGLDAGEEHPDEKPDGGAPIPGLGQGRNERNVRGDVQRLRQGVFAGAGEEEAGGVASDGDGAGGGEGETEAAAAAGGAEGGRRWRSAATVGGGGDGWRREGGGDGGHGLAGGGGGWRINSTV